jgi:hypothetical protein
MPVINVLVYQNNIIIINNNLLLFQALSIVTTVLEILFYKMVHELQNLLSSNRRIFKFDNLKKSFIVYQSHF